MKKDDAQHIELKNDSEIRQCIDGFSSFRKDIMFQLIRVNGNFFSIPMLCSLMDIDMDLFCSMINDLSGSDLIRFDGKEIISHNGGKTDFICIPGYPIKIDITNNSISINAELFSQSQKELIKYLFNQKVAFYVRDNGKGKKRININEIGVQFSVSESEAKEIIEYANIHISECIKTDNDEVFCEHNPMLDQPIEAHDAQKLKSILKISSISEKEWNEQVEQLISLGYARKHNNRLYKALDHDPTYSPKLTTNLLKQLKYRHGDEGYKSIDNAINPCFKEDDVCKTKTHDRITRILLSYHDEITQVILSLFRTKETETLCYQEVKDALQITDNQLANSLWTLRSRGMDFKYEKNSGSIRTSNYSINYEEWMRLKLMTEWFIDQNKAKKIISEGITRDEIGDYFGIKNTRITETIKEWKAAGFVFANQDGFVNMSLAPDESFHGDENTFSNIFLNVYRQGFIDQDCSNTLLLLLAIGSILDNTSFTLDDIKTEKPKDDVFDASKKPKDVFDVLKKLMDVFNTIEKFHERNTFTEIKNSVLKEHKMKSLEGCSDEVKDEIFDKQRKRAIQLLKKYAVPAKRGMEKVDGYITKKSSGSVTKFTNDFFLRINPLQDSMEDYSKIIAEGSFQSKFLLGVVNQTHRMMKSSLAYGGGQMGDLTTLNAHIGFLNQHDYKNNFLSFTYLANSGKEIQYNKFRAYFVGYSQSSGRAYLLGYSSATEIKALRLSNIYWETMKHEAPKEEKDAEKAKLEADREKKRMEEMDRLKYEMFEFAPEKLIPVKVEFFVKDHQEIVEELREHQNSREQTCKLAYKYGKKNYTKEYDKDKIVERIMYTDRVRGLGDLSRFLRRYTDIIYKIWENDDLKKAFRENANNVMENYSEETKSENPAPVFEDQSEHLDMTYGDRFTNTATIAFPKEYEHLKHVIEYSVEGTTQDGLEIAVVDKKGTITAKCAGDVVVKAVCRENAEFSASRSEYRLTIHKAKQEMTVKNEKDPLVFVNETFAVCVEGAKTEVEYRIDASCKDNAMVDNEGIVTALKPGKAIILVTALENDKYLECTASYPFEIHELPDSAKDNGMLFFHEVGPLNFDLSENYESHKIPAELSNEFASGRHDAVISYHVIKDKPSDLRTVKANKSGVIVPLNAGDATVMATCVFNNDLISFAKYHLTIKGAKQVLHVPSKPIILYQDDECTNLLKGMRTSPVYVSEDASIVEVLYNGSTLRAKNIGTVKICVTAKANEKYQQAKAEFDVEVRDRNEKIKVHSAKDNAHDDEMTITRVDKTVQYSPICRMAHLLHTLISLAEEDKTTMKDLANKLMLPLKIVKNDIYDVCMTEPAASLIKIRFLRPNETEWWPLRKIKKVDFLMDSKYDGFCICSKYMLESNDGKKGNYLVLNDAEEEALKKTVTRPDDYVYKGISYVKSPIKVLGEKSSAYIDIDNILKSRKSCMVSYTDSSLNQKTFGALPITSLINAVNGQQYVVCINEPKEDGEKLEISFLDAQRFNVNVKKTCVSLDEKIILLGGKLLEDAELAALGFDSLPSTESRKVYPKEKLESLNNMAFDKVIDLGMQLCGCAWVPESIPLEKESLREIKIGIKKDQTNVMEKIKREIAPIQNSGNASIDDGEDGNDVLTITISGGMAEFKRWLLSYGGSIKVISPTTLGEEICTIYEELLNRL